MISLPQTSSDLLHDPGYPALKDFIIQTTGLAYYVDKDDDLLQRIERRLAPSGRPDCQAYLNLLKDAGNGDSELDRLAEELTVGETSFFRHAEMFDGLRSRVLPDLIARNQSCRRLRIWSAGSSIGAEVYSIAILLATEFIDQVKGWEISILGTDINRGFLARANEGIFRAWDFRGVDLPRIEGCFLQRGDEWVIRPEYHRWVNFQYHNLVRYPFPSLINNLVAFDLILCRNVLIYFDSHITQRLIGQFYETMVDGGWLLVGHAETNVELFRSFRTVNVPGAVLYQKPDATSACGDGASPSGGSVGFGAGGRASGDVITTSPATQFMRHVQVSSRCEQAKKSELISPPIPRPSSCQHAGVPGKKTDYADLSSIRRLADQGDLEGAVQWCEALISRNPLDPSPHFYRAMLAEQIGDHRQSQASLRQTIYLDPNNALAHYYFGLLQQKRGERDEALRSYENVLGFLAGLQDDTAIPEAESMIVSDLRDLTRMQQEVLSK